MIPKYIRLKDTLCEAINSKKYPLYSKLPTEVELAEEYSVSRATVRSALALMADEGIIDKKWGSGNTVIGIRDSSAADTIVLIYGGDSDQSVNELTESLRNYLYKEGFSLKYYETRFSQTAERDLLQTLLREVYAGFIFIPTCSAIPNINGDLYQKLLRWNTPLLFVGSAPNVPGSSGFSCIQANDYNCGYSAARHMINLGFNEIGGIFDKCDSSSLERFRGFAEAVRDADMTLCEDQIFWTDTVSTDRVPGRHPLRLDAYLNDTCIELPEDIYTINSRSSSGIHFEPVTDPAAAISDLFLSIKKDGGIKSSVLKYRLVTDK